MSANNHIYHSHHIIPRHEWRRRYGSEKALDETGRNLDHPSNLMSGLTAKQHAEEHRKLWEKFGQHDDFVAWQALSGQIGKEDIFLLKLQSPERCQKISKAKKGKNHHFYGKSFSVLHKQHLSESRQGGTPYKGHKHSSITKEKMKLRHIGRKHSPETIEKMKLARLKYWAQRKC